MHGTDPTAALAAEYSAKADAYAHHWSPVIRPMALPLLQHLPLQEADRVLDGGSGTGAHVLDLREAAPHAAIVAVDRAEGMLRAIPGRYPRAVMDLQALAIADASIDVATLVFVLFHLPDPVQGLVEIRRVLRSGGCAGVATWGVDPGVPGLGVWRAELDRAGAPPDPRDPVVMQQSAMDAPDKLRQLLSRAGYVSAEIWSLECVHTFTPESLIAVQTGCGMPMRRLAGMPPAAQAACEARVREAIEALTREELTYRPEVLFAIGQKARPKRRDSTSSRLRARARRVPPAVETSRQVFTRTNEEVDVTDPAWQRVLTVRPGLSWSPRVGPARQVQPDADQRARSDGYRVVAPVLHSRRVARRPLPACLCACLLLPTAARAGERWTIGLSTSRVPIEAVAIAGRSASSPTVLLVGGLQGRDRSSEAVEREAAAFERIPPSQRAFRLIAVASANPDAQPLRFPPSGAAYREDVESHLLWRWVGIHAPDLVLVAGPDPGLVDALSQHVVADVGRIPARRVDASTRVLRSVSARITPSGARQEVDRRLARSPRALAEELARVYGRQFTAPNYIAAMAVVSRLRLGERDEVAGLLAPYLDGAQDSFARPSQSSLAAHLLFFEHARRARDDRAKALVVRAAASGFTENGELREFMPLHGGWSDSLFMDVPILAMAGALTGERRYFDMAARHVAFMQQIVLRPDGLYRHQASADAAWGRGNAFPALGLALTLSEFPKEHADHPRLLTSYRSHMAALARFQDENGMWRNVIDRPGAYPEYSATAMIATAMLRGIRNGWIDRETYEPLVQKAWKAILSRTGPDGRLVDVCESTGTRGLTDDDYLRRAAILGRDDRGGGMAMFFATELAGL